MKMDRRGFTARLGAALAGLSGLSAAAPLAAQAQDFPNKLVRIVPFGTAGGPIDTLARVYSEKLGTRWGQSIIVEPKPGAAGTLAADAVAKASPDGHTALFTLSITQINNAILQPKLPYDPVKDFEPVSVIATGGPVLVARVNAPYGTVKEFLEFAKRQPKGMTYGTWGNGSTAHLLGELLERQSGTNLIHVPYKGESAAHSDLFGETIDFAWANPATARTHAQAGKMKILGITGSRRVSLLPDVPTFTEQGLEGFDLDSWIAVYLPAKTPAPIVQAWATAMREITAMSDVRGRLTAFGFEPLGSTAQELAQRQKADFPRVADLIRKAGVTIE